MDVQDRAWRLFEHCLSQEHCLKLIANRNLDVIMLSSIQTSLMVAGLPNDLIKVIEQYRLQPQFSQKTIHHVYIKNGLRGELVQFTKQVFVKRVTPFMEVNDIHLG